ncbi:RND family efflux transporter, MFP subunit [Arboricoccus pini]|uniref:RND family efflux transporter, MFP subunit n=1 Tax=Arboricoccus pini TaxID=1963835 RepID=A0A212RRW2_9PROT|nr:efflux RND transporter periplasmic adaptor subunit [Arboricoccus pini]SNB75228.1 RND family efflux transporter, MFP subunit [Arboricoccus pini]
MSVTPPSSPVAARTSPRHARRWLGAGFLALLAVGGVLSFEQFSQSTDAAETAAAPPPPQVTVAHPLERQVAGSTEFTGQFSAVDYVEIRAQVSGYLTEIHFTDGQIVKKGDLLFVIDPRPYEIQLQQAQARLQTAQANLELANKQLSRTTELKRSDFASGELLDQRTQGQRSAQADLDDAKAAIRAAALNVEFTHVIAPLSGKISTHRASIGSLVNGGQTASSSTLLTTIVSLDPIHLDFEMSESDYLAFRRYQQDVGPTAIDRKVDVRLSDEKGWPRQGMLSFVDNQIDRASGTIHARADIPNPDLFIAPGQFARLRLPTSAARSTLLVPDAAVMLDQSTQLVLTVKADGTVVPKPVELGQLVDGLRVVKSGLAPADQVIINGLMLARPGTKVTPAPGSIEPQPEG